MPKRVVASWHTTRPTPANFGFTAAWCFRLRYPWCRCSHANQTEGSAASFLHAPAINVVGQVEQSETIQTPDCRINIHYCNRGLLVQIHSPNACEKKHAVPNAGNYSSLSFLSSRFLRAEPNSHFCTETLNAQTSIAPIS
jgi:hypothetical protein